MHSHVMYTMNTFIKSYQIEQKNKYINIIYNIFYFTWILQLSKEKQLVSLTCQMPQQSQYKPCQHKMHHWPLKVLLKYYHKVRQKMQRNITGLPWSHVELDSEDHWILKRPQLIFWGCVLRFSSLKVDVVK